MCVVRARAYNFACVCARKCKCARVRVCNPLKNELDDSDEALIKKLKEETSLNHSPAFDTVNSRLSTEGAGGGKTRVEQFVTLTASGMVSLWPSKIRKGMKRSVGQTLKNFQK